MGNSISQLMGRVHPLEIEGVRQINSHIASISLPRRLVGADSKFHVFVSKIKFLAAGQFCPYFHYADADSYFPEIRLKMLFKEESSEIHPMVTSNRKEKVPNYKEESIPQLLILFDPRGGGSVRLKYWFACCWCDFGVRGYGLLDFYIIPIRESRNSELLYFRTEEI